MVLYEFIISTTWRVLPPRSQNVVSNWLQLTLQVLAPKYLCDQISLPLDAFFKYHFYSGLHIIPMCV